MQSAQKNGKTAWLAYPRAWTGYVVAVLGTAVAAALRWALEGWVGELPPFITFYPVVISAALLGGTFAGILAAVLSDLACTFFFIPPIAKLWPLAPNHATGLALFTGINIILSVVGGRLRTDYYQSRLQAAALKAADNAIVITDRLGSIVWVNPAFERLTGYRAEDALRQTPRILNSGQHEPAFFQEMWRTVLARSVWHGDVVNKRKDGTLYTEEMTITPLADPAGSITHFIAVKQDITQRKQAEAELREARDQLARANADLERTVQQRTDELRHSLEELQAFSYSLVHDMRAPLRAMHNFAGLAIESCRPSACPDTLDYLRRIQTASARLDLLVTDALSYTRVLGRDFPLKPVDLGGLLRGIVETYPNLQAPRAEVRIDFKTLVLLGNEAVLTQVLSNLLSNAVKFVAPGVDPRVTIRAEPPPPGTQPSSQDSFVRLWIEDNGIGIPTHAHEKIFGIFQRLHRDGEFPGTGMGLALARKAVQRLGGRIGVESEPGHGSRFWIELPSVPPSPEAAHPRPAP